jgi:hypothetical protein
MWIPLRARAASHYASSLHHARQTASHAHPRGSHIIPSTRTIAGATTIGVLPTGSTTTDTTAAVVGSCCSAATQLPQMRSHYRPRIRSMHRLWPPLRSQASGNTAAFISSISPNATANTMASNFYGTATAPGLPYRASIRQCRLRDISSGPGAEY